MRPTIYRFTWAAAATAATAPTRSRRSSPCNTSTTGRTTFSESGADGADLSVAPLDAHSLRSRVGGQLQRVCQWGETKIVPQFYAGWAHEYLENDLLEARFLGGVTPFTIDRGGIFRDAGYYGVGLTALPRDHASVFARYNGEYSSGGHFTAVDLGLMIEY